MDSPDSLSSAQGGRDISKELQYVSQRLEGTPECGLDDYLHDQDDHIDDAIRTLRSRGLSDAGIEKARRWNQPPMYALQDKAHFNLLLAASNSIGAPHSKTELKEAFLRKEFETKRDNPRSGQKPLELLQILEEQNADAGTLAFCRDALQGEEAAQDAATRLVELIVKWLRMSRRSDLETWKIRTRGGVRKARESKKVKK